MRKACAGQIAVALALAMLSGCSPPPAPEPASTDSILLANGVELPILPGVKRQQKCEFIKEHDISQRKHVICLEYAGSLAQQPDGGIQNLYTNLLLERGFIWDAGSGVEYFFDWPEAGGCRQRFSIASVPKTMPANRSDWSTVEEFVLVMSFGRRTCEKKRT